MENKPQAVATMKHGLTPAKILREHSEAQKRMRSRHLSRTHSYVAHTVSQCVGFIQTNTRFANLIFIRY